MRRKLIVVFLAGGVVAATAAGLAQERSTPAPLPASSPTGSLDALTNEVRLLRLAIEKSSQSQVQIQALAVYSAAQQSRLVNLASQSETAQREADANDAMVAEVAQHISSLERTLATNTSLPPNERQALEALIASRRQESAALSARSATLRGRTAEANAAVQTELARWNELMARLEQATRPN